MTIHSAKGLEFPVVMIAGLEEGLFPLGPQSYEIEELEEERRLFYVAVTRAKKKVYLSYANARRRFGGAPMPAVQSRFISELPENLVEVNGGPQQAAYSKSFTPKPSFQSASSSPSKLQKGDQVAHKLFGNGRILDVEGEGDSAKTNHHFLWKCAQKTHREVRQSVFTENSFFLKLIRKPRKLTKGFN